MENNELREKLKKIIEKRSRSEQLTNEERIFADQIVDKMLTSKAMLNKVFEHKTGDDLRKADESPTLAKPKSTVPSFEGTPPQSRGFEGGYNSKADISERAGVSPDPGNYTGSPTRKYPEYFSEEGKQTPTEDNSGTIKAEYETEEYSDTDGKPYENPYYEEDRVGRYIEGHAPKTGSIKVSKGDVVAKQIGSNTLLGWVLKVHDPFNGNQAVMVKWSNHTFSHENVANITVLKAQGSKSEKTKKEEDVYSSPPVKKQEDAEKQSQARSRQRPLRSPGYRVPGGGIVYPKPPTLYGKSIQTEDVRKGKLAEASQAAERLRKRAGDVQKGEKPPSEWLDRCVESLKAKGNDVDEPYAVCISTYNKMKNKFASGEDIEKDVTGNIIVRLTPEDLEKDCPGCAEKMRKRNIKFLKNVVDVKELEKYGLSIPTSRIQRPVSAVPTQVSRTQTTQQVRRPRGVV